jgi:hypothetical protein
MTNNLGSPKTASLDDVKSVTMSKDFQKRLTGLHPNFLSSAIDEFRIIRSFPHLDQLTEWSGYTKIGVIDRPQS